MNISSGVLFKRIFSPASIRCLVSTSPEKLDDILVAELSIQRVVIQVLLPDLSALVALVSDERSVENIGALVHILLRSFSMFIL
jgi:hypothetical protein